MSEEAVQDTGDEAVVADAAPASFHDSLSEDLRTIPGLQKFTDVNALAKGYVNLESFVGSDKIPLPPASATDDQWREVYTKLGAPAEGSAYEVGFNNTAITADELNTFKENALRAGLNNKQAQVMAEYLDQAYQSANEQFDQSADEVRQGYVQELQKEYGQAFEQKVGLALAASNHLLGPEVSERLTETVLSDGSLLGDHPDFIRMFVQLSEQIGEDNLEGSPTELIMTPEEASRQIAEMTRRDGPYFDRLHPEHENYVAEVLRLREYM